MYIDSILFYLIKFQTRNESYVYIAIAFKYSNIKAKIKRKII